MKNTILACVSLCMILAAGGCSVRQPRVQQAVGSALANGDSTLYGLACDGCNDTIIVFLNDPYDGSDPDTLDILEASRQHRVFGTVRIGDRLAIMRSREDSTKAAQVIVTQDLIGQWCYKVKPRLKARAGMGADGLDTDAGGMDADSLHALLEEEREYGLALKIDSVAVSIGGGLRQATMDDESPVEYPGVKHYRRWYVSNGLLLLLTAGSDTLAHGPREQADTAELVLLKADTLVLRFADGERGYYRKEE